MVWWSDWLAAILSCVLLTSVFTAGEAQEVSSNPLIIGGIFDKSDVATPAVFEAAVAAANRRPGPRLAPRIFRIARDDVNAANTSVCSLLGDGAVAIVTDAGSRVSELAGRISDRAEVPLLTVEPWRSRLQAFSVSLRPTFPAVLRASAPAVRERRAAFFTTVSDRATIEAKRKVVQRISNQFSFHLWRSSNNSLLLDALRNSQITDFYIDLPPMDVQEFLFMIRQKRMNGARFTYNILIQDLGFSVATIAPSVRLASSMRSRTLIHSVTPLDRPDRSEEVRSAVVKATGDLQAVIPANAAFIYDGVQLVSEALNALSLARRVVTRPLSCGGSIYWAQGTSLFMYILTGLSSVDKTITGRVAFNSSSRHRDTFTINSYNSTELDLDGSQASKGITRRAAGSSPLVGKVLRVVTVRSPLFVTMEKVGNTQVFKGHNIELLQYMAREVGFNYTIQEATGRRFGSKKSDTNQWTGMIGDLLEGRADLAVAPLMVTYERQRVVDFTRSFMTFGLKILTFKPTEDVAPTPAIFLEPFHLFTWIGILIAYVIVSFAIFIVAKISPFEWHRHHQSADVRINDFSLLNAFWFTIGGCLRQYPGLAPRSTSVRILAAFWWIAVLIFFLYYVCNFFSMPSSKKESLPFSSFYDLRAQNKVKFGCLRGSSTQAYFKNAKNGVFKYIYYKMNKTPGSFKDSYSQGIAAVLRSEGKYAFIGEGPILDSTATRNCKLKTLPHTINYQEYAFALPKNSPYTEPLNMALLKLRQNNHLEMLTRSHLGRYKANCEEEPRERRGARRFSPRELMFVFVLLAIGLILSLVIAICECVCNRCCNFGRRPTAAPLADFRSSLTSNRRAID